ncbi:hypothetical protein C2G38_2127010, partial [Gigaspora rosea]
MCKYLMHLQYNFYIIRIFKLISFSILIQHFSHRVKKAYLIVSYKSFFLYIKFKLI